MKKNKIIYYCKNCHKPVHEFEMQDGFKICMKRRKDFCLDCKPYIPKYGVNSICHCKVCGDENPDHFISGRLNICNDCSKERNKLRIEEAEKRNRKILDEVLGTKCSCCGYDKYKEVLNVHHLDETKKSTSYDRYCRTWPEEVLRKELYNCIRLCRNCHTAIHSGEIGIKDFQFTVNDNKGKQVVICINKPPITERKLYN